MPFAAHFSTSLDLIAREAFVKSGWLAPVPAQNSFIPPPVPVDSITGAVLPSAAKVSPTIVVKGYTVDEPTIRISLASATVVTANTAKRAAANDFTIFISYMVNALLGHHNSEELFLLFISIYTQKFSVCQVNHK
jgi:hypothetical protein